jgi:ankyrin repeat protein
MLFITFSLFTACAMLPRVSFDAGKSPVALLQGKACQTTKVKTALQRGADANERDAQGYTALMLAARLGCRELIPLLIERGADVQAKEPKHGQTALHLAATRGDEAIVRALLDAEAQINAKDAGGMTALMLAAKGGSLNLSGFVAA